MNTSRSIQLLLIDPQNDFCDILGAHLPVPGADRDMKRVARLIERIGGDLDAIHVTLDSHHPVDIAHPAWWVDKSGQSPAPFTIISADDVAQGVWRTRDPAEQSAGAEYVRALARSGRYMLVVWPEHCLIGSWGHNVHQDVATALSTWARLRMKQVDYVFKGSNPRTEHYSAIQAEVPDPGDPSTQLNRPLVNALARADRVIIAGEALSHCVASTVRDLMDNFTDDQIQKLVLLTDCTSSVPGFESLGEKFLHDATARGMQTATSDNLRLR